MRTKRSNDLKETYLHITRDLMLIEFIQMDLQHLSLKLTQFGVQIFDQ